MSMKVNHRQILPSGGDGDVQYSYSSTLSSDVRFNYNPVDNRLKVEGGEVGVRSVALEDSTDGVYHTWIRERPSNTFRRLQFVGDPDPTGAFGVVYTPSSATLQNSVFVIWNVDFDRGVTGNYSGFTLDSGGIFRIFTGSTGSGNDVSISLGTPYGDDFTFKRSNKFFGIGNSSPTNKLTVGKPGDGTNAISNQWAVYSDQRIKENISDAVYDDSTIAQLSAKTFNFISDPDKKTKLGLVAQDVAAVIPEAVDNSSGLLQLDYNSIVSVLVNAVKSLYNKVVQLQTDVETLKQQ